ncbi:TonB-dependent receptor [Janthinobacterium sp. ROICE36]|uniref:TonB-dependent receptor domain-containing protein n=1 Tax=Janthinobacterium sp. ROICE36 TaxID=2048670 RepID=UPI000C7EA72D|nr:TonB-dependent receptor [Janthinobacterium sp. ROICE36]PLY43321.1 TonB-dependent receptor [Janthinobacterium sp. ROICE36]
MSNSTRRPRLPRPTTLALALATLSCLPAYAQTGTPASMPEVVVSASGFEQDIKQAPASITVLTRAELSKERFGNLTQALESVEGIDVGAAGDKTGGMNISIRGMPSDYTLVLIDGRRQNAAGNVTPNGFGGTQTSFMPPLAAIERIEIIRGPMSTLYGSDAMGGVINIITRKVGKQWMGSVSADYTLQQESDFGDVKNGRFYLSGPIATDLLGLSLRGSKQRRDAANIGYNDAAGAEIVPNMGANPVRADIANFGARLAFTPNRYHTVILDADAGRQTYDNSNGQLGTKTVQGGYGPEQKYKRDQWTLSHTGRFGFGTLDSSYMVNKTETLGRTIPPGTPGAVAGSARTLEVESQVFDTKLVMPLGKHMATIGAQWWRAEMTDGVAPKKFEFTQKALFVEDEWQVLEHLALTFGARYDDHSIFGGQTSPRAYAVWNATPSWTVKGGVSKGYKTPRVEQLSPGINGFGGQGTIPLVGSPNLKPETSTTTEIGAYFDNLAGWTASGSLFNNTFKDKITTGTGLVNCDYRPSPNRPDCVSFGNWPNVDAFGQSVNVDEAVTRGVELNTRFPLGKTLSASANYTYTESEQKSGSNAGKPLSDTPKHAVDARLSWDISREWNGWLRAEYRSERFRDPGTSASTRAAKAALGDYQGYTMLHLGSSYQLNQRVTLTAAVYNLLNKDFIDYQPYRQGSGPALTYANRYVNSLDGRRLWLSATVDF